MAAWCSWEQAEDAQATDPAGRGEMQRARAEAGNNHSTERSWWSSPARGCSGCPLWLEVLTEFIHPGSSPGQSVMTNGHLEVRTAIKQQHLHGWT